eukprot:TRINITY_DN41486_c0_g1_i1.p1 TRINITY_DN41486_c0_g1~~TRINITY_DN41486_c0_g1_i1.p1  ORF type:complete len:2351 (-),score=301.60 TRINITY_DN41486_c0_g1_i1:61-7113(-)
MLQARPSAPRTWRACLLQRLQLGSGKQLRALFFCWLSMSSHVIGSPVMQQRSTFESAGSSEPGGDSSLDSASFAAPPGHEFQWGEDAHLVETEDVRLQTDEEMLKDIVRPHVDEELLKAMRARRLEEARKYWEAKDKEEVEHKARQAAEGRELQVAPPPFFFFTREPFVNIVVFDSHDSYCDRNFESPPVTDPEVVGYPADATDTLRQRHMACGIAPARFVFTTSDLPAYDDNTIDAKMQIRITCTNAYFVESLTCENVLDSTGEFPRIEGCRFMTREARLILQTRMKARSTYSLTIKLVMPPGRMTASNNSYTLTTEFDPSTVIEGTRSPVDLGYTVPHAKDPIWGTDYQVRGYITGFSWNPSLAYKSSPGTTTIFTFGLRTFGRMDSRYAMDIVAYPTNIWKLGIPGDDCQEFTPPHIGTTCRLMSFQGALATESNGFRLRVGTTPMVNLGSLTTPEFSLRVTNPAISVNMYWTATSFRIDEDQLRQEPYTVFIDRPIGVMGAPTGSIAAFERGDVAVDQWVTLEFRPGNTVMPATTTSGILVIIPPTTFFIISSATPQQPDLQYNQLPCQSWPEADRLAGRWLCPLQDTAPMKTTLYRVKLKVRNPAQPGAAQSWRVEFWEQDATKPVSITRGIRGMEVSGPMAAALSQENQLLGSINSILISVTPSQPIGNVVGTRLRVQAPPGFLIIKRCLNFQPIELPDCECQGSDSNSFELVFPEPGAVQGGVHYSFRLSMQNPVTNIADSVNVWAFDTLRPDGIGRDTARVQGFFLYPYEFSTFTVVPQSRKIGPQTIVVRFTSPLLIPFDDYIRIRAPNGVKWYTADLQFSTDPALTQANYIGATNPTVEFARPNELVVQLTTTAQANFEYGLSARAEIPQVTPVPNAWWVEQYRRTGLSAPNSWRYLSSRGATGFKTQVLVNAKIEPFNIVAEGWQNPTLFVFETTMEIMPMMQATASGTKLVPAVLRVTAPPDFTFICPTSKTVYMPLYSISIPSDVTCLVDHNNLALRNRLDLEFPTGLQGNTRYAFTVDVVNAWNVAPTSNYFLLQTMLDGEVMEEARVQGFLLAQKMDNTRYISWPTLEDRRVEAKANRISFIIGTTLAIPTFTTLEVKAPIGFKFAADCTLHVGEANWVRMPNEPLLQLPPIDLCQNLASQSPEKTNYAHIQMIGPWALGSYGLYVTVENPMFTPARNFWGFTIYDRDLTPRMSESWVYGFLIQVVLNPQLRSYNSGNGIDGEAAINYVDISFALTTRVPAHPISSHTIRVTAPKGFFFPNICRGFTLDTFTPGFNGLPKGTGCQGNSGPVLKIVLPRMHALENGTNYMFRFLVVNPRDTFTVVNTTDKYWRVETELGSGEMVDLYRVLPSFPIMVRLRYFKVDALSQVGLNSTYFRFLFRTDQPLPPQQTVHIYPPAGTAFGGLAGGACIDMDPVLLSLMFPTALISGVTRLPEWVSCRVMSKGELMLRNEEPILGGRPLISGPVFEFFLMNASNPESTPQLNIFRIIAKTSTPAGQEEWVAPGWVIFPELTRTNVEVSNPGYGLYTNFTITLQTITEVPELGSIRIVAPDDYYFGPVRETPESAYNPLVAQPGPAGAGESRPDPDVTTICHILRTPNWQCALDFTTCRNWQEIEDRPGNLNGEEEENRVLNRNACLRQRAKCAEGGALSDLVSCKSQGSTLDLELSPDVVLPSRRILNFLIQGYNARRQPESAEANTWNFMTRNADSEKTVLDAKPKVPGVTLIGIINVDSIVPSNTKVGSIENYVTVTLRLTTQCDPRAVLRITHPMQYLRGANAAFSGPAIATGYTFPQQIERRQSLNVIELEAIEESYPANTPLVLTLGLSNPRITPRRAENVWTFEAFSLASGQSQRLNVNLNVTGFKIFGEFSKAAVTATVLSPNAQTIIGAWFSLKSVLSASSSSQMKIWMPKGFVPVLDCGGKQFQPTYNPNREGVKNPFPSTNTYFPLPSGTECYDRYDVGSDQYYIELRIDLMVDYGLDFAFEFAVTNPEKTPPAAINVWRFETLQTNVILHLERSIPGFELEQIKDVSVMYSDTTTLLPLHRVTFSMMSDKYIPGGSKIEITGPNGYIFTCAFFQTDRGLANTTTCYVRSPNVAEFTMDTSDPKQPNSPFRLYVYVSNPEFTPQNNWWNFRIISPLGKTIDMRDEVPSFDITGRVTVDVQATFPYLGQANPLRVVFKQTTILNQADIGNEFVLTAPGGYIFPVNCTGFKLRYSNAGGASSSSQKMPPDGMTCSGFNNATVVIRFPDNAGLLRANYTLEIDVQNPAYQPNGTTWSFITRVRNPTGERIVDANRTLEGFELVELVPLRTDEGYAERLAHLSLPMLGFTTLWPALT